MRHVGELDGIRAIAILIVFAGHSGLKHIVPGGLGVTIFFFLSGFLITSLMRAEMASTGAIDLGAFYLRRVLRIMPPLWITLSFSALIMSMGWLDEVVDPAAVPSQLLLTINYAHLWGHDEGLPAMPLWSLAVEEHFYLLFPLAFSLLIGRKTGQTAAAICAGLCLLVLLVRIGNIVFLDDFSRNDSWSHTRVDSILFGCCLALWHNPVMDRDAWRPCLAHVAVALAVILLTLLVRDQVFRLTIRYTLQGCALFVLFSYALQAGGHVGAILKSRAAKMIGLYSYTIYLSHYTFFVLVDAHLPSAGLAMRALLAGIGSLVFSFVMHVYVERPIARARHRLHGSHQALAEV